MLPYALPAQVYAAGLVFLRVGSIVMLMPGVGEGFVPPRIRLAFALLLSLCLAPIALPSLPPMPSTVGELGGQVLKELLVGLMLGALLRFFLSALSVAGEVISIQTTLAFAQTANPLQAQPGTTVALRAVATSFSLGLQLAAPLMVFSLVFNVALGLVGRVMPQFQIFFAGAPLTLILGLSIFGLSFGGGVLVWLDRYRDFLRLFT